MPVLRRPFRVGPLKSRKSKFPVLSAALCLALLSCGSAFAQQFDPNSYAGMRWRLIGPYRAGRVTAVAGISSDPAIYYMGTPDGGGWKTTDGGQAGNRVSNGTGVAAVGAMVRGRSN